MGRANREQTGSQSPGLTLANGPWLNLGIVIILILQLKVQWESENRASRGRFCFQRPLISKVTSARAGAPKRGARARALIWKDVTQIWRGCDYGHFGMWCSVMKYVLEKKVEELQTEIEPDWSQRILPYAAGLVVSAPNER